VGSRREHPCAGASWIGLGTSSRGAGRCEKCVSLEEYFLLERLGRRGSLPESLVLASFVELARWLVVVSSEFESSALLTDVLGFSFRDPLGMGAVLEDGGRGH